MFFRRTQDVQTIHDFFGERKWVFILYGASSSKSFFYKSYIVFIYLFLTVSLILTGMTFLYLETNKDFAIRILHAGLYIVFAMSSLSVRFLTADNMTDALRMLKTGVFSRDHLGDEQTDSQRRGVLAIRKRTDLLAYATYTCLNTFLVVLPLGHFFILNTEIPRGSTVNPYLPLPFYMPVDTSRILGFWLSYSLNAIALAYIYAAAVTTSDLYISCSVQLRTQIQLLNSSLKKIYHRAHSLYTSISQTNDLHEMIERGLESNFLLTDSVFQKCLSACLVEDIKHHQSILRFYKNCSVYLRASFLVIVTLSAIISASHIYLISQGPPLNLFIIYIFSLAGELFFTYSFIYNGEPIEDEGYKLFSSLYDLPWPDCTKEFRQMVNIVMTFTLSPIKIATRPFNIGASHETYGEIISGMYKIMSLMRQM
nr:olfactory receptor 46 [Tropidothorax elegans]